MKATNTFMCNGVLVKPGDSMPELTDTQRTHYLQKGWAVEEIKVEPKPAKRKKS